MTYNRFPSRSYSKTHQTIGILALTLMLVAPVGAQTPTPVFSPDSIRKEIGYLASDALQGRDSGDPGNEKAAQFVAAEFARDGLKPLGTSHERDASAPMDGSGYYQPFTFLAGHKLGKNSRLEVVLKDSTSTATMGYKQGVQFRPSGVSGEGKAEGQLIFVGYGIHAPKLNHDDFADVDVKGKVLLLAAGSPGDNPHDPLYEYGSLLRKASDAYNLGAKAILIFSPKAGDDLKPGRFEFQQNDDAGMPILRILPALAESFVADTKQHRSLKDLLTDADAGKSVSLALPEEVHLTADVKKITKVTANVVGMIEGSDPALKNEYVVIGAHLDHLGWGSPYSLAKSDAPAIHHGADDNASGTAGVMELARYFSGHETEGRLHVSHPGTRTVAKAAFVQAPRLKRSVIFMCFSGEELGLYGSEHYVKHPILPLEQTVAMLNMDMVGRMRDNKLIVVGSESAPTFADLLKEADQSPGIDIAKSAGDFGGGSDHESFENKQIPILFFFTGTHEDYHTPTDTVDKINAVGEAKVLQLVADCTERIADASERPVFVHQQRPAQTTTGGFAVYFGSVPDYAAQVTGVQLNGVRDGSPAAKAGLKPGDIIVKFGDRTIKNVYDYTYALQDHKPGDVVQVVVQRAGQTLTLTATLAARPQ